MQQIFELIDKTFGLLANFFTVILGAKSGWEIFKFIKNKKKVSSLRDKSYRSVSLETHLTQNINNNFFGYFEYNFKDSKILTKTEMNNYNYDSKVIWKCIYYPTFLVVFVYFIDYWITANSYINWTSEIEIFNNIEVLVGSITSSLAQALQQTFSLTWLAQVVVSLLVIIKMVSASNILYRKTNIALYSLSLFFTWHLNNIFSTLSFEDTNVFNLIINTSANFSLESMKPLFKFYSVLILFFQLIYTIYVLYSGIRILKIGELKYLEKEEQFKKIYHGKFGILISPIILYILWYYFKLYIA